MHLELAKVAKHPLDELPPGDQSLTFAIHNLQRAGLGILQFRDEMLTDIQLLVEEFTDVTTAWCNNLPSHARAVYVDKSGLPMVQFPVMLHLLKCSI
jgi:hypothetical protein